MARSWEKRDRKVANTGRSPRRLAWARTVRVRRVHCGRGNLDADFVILPALKIPGKRANCTKCRRRELTKMSVDYKLVRATLDARKDSRLRSRSARASARGRVVVYSARSAIR